MDALKNKPDVPAVQSENFEGVPAQMMQDGFASLLVTMLREPFLSGDTKYLIISGMLDKLSKKYSPEEMNKFKAGINRVVAAYNNVNDFMG